MGEALNMVNGTADYVRYPLTDFSVLLVGEGRDDIGYGPDKQESGASGEVKGALQPLLEKILRRPLRNRSQRARFVRVSIGEVRAFVAFPKVHSNDSAGSLVGAKVAGLALMKSCDHVAYHEDCDDESFERRYREVRRILSPAREHGFRCLPLVPNHTIESWLMGDEHAFEATFGRRPTEPPLPEEPEKCWDKPARKDGRHPKQVMGRVLAQYHEKRSAQAYTRIAENSNPETIASACPSFQRVLDDLSDFI